MDNNPRKMDEYRSIMPSQFEIYEEIDQVISADRSVSTDSRDILEAKEVLNRIKKGIPIEHAIVNEDIIYSESEHEKSIKFDVKIHDCIFKGNVCLESLIFKGKVNISHVTFCQKTSFSSSRFRKNATFSKIFKGEVDFSGAIFDKEASLSNSHFKEAIFFSRLVDDEFKHATFHELAVFMNSQFKNMDFERVRFNGDVNFRESQFDGIIGISSTYFNSSVEFNTTNKGRSQFKEGKERCKIRLHGANFHRLMVHWIDIKDHLEAEDPSDLGSLIKNYAELGWFDDADNCYLAYKKLLIYNDYLKFLMPVGILKVRSIKFIKKISNIS